MDNRMQTHFAAHPHLTSQQPEEALNGQTACAKLASKCIFHLSPK